ncbi:MAG: hypothetical protein IT182_17295 [Acidobacteria bacterium]|nr:hypothetical protein [Acidobacteriota bacterium]
MANLLQKGVEWLDVRRKAHLASSVVYTRPSILGFVGLQATLGETVFDQVDEHGVVHRFESRDFLITAADLVLGGSVTLPVAGDRITVTINGMSRVHEVMAPGDEQPYRFCDPHRVTMRIHTKFISEA